METYAAHGHLSIIDTFLYVRYYQSVHYVASQNESIEILGKFLRQYVGEYVKRYLSDDYSDISRYRC